MSEFILCNRPIKRELLPAHCLADADLVFAADRNQPDTLKPFTPYLHGDTAASRGLQTIAPLAPAQGRELTNLALTYGEDEVVALSDLFASVREYNIGMIGASTSVYANRIGGFAGSILEYQTALLNYRDAVKNKSPQAGLMKQRAHLAFNQLQTKFRHELNAITAKNRARRGTPLTSATRATNIARSSRSAVKLNVADYVQSKNLVKFAGYAKGLGNGLAVIDFGSRVGNIHNSYQAGENWERELFVESSSFAASAMAGAGVVKVGGAVLGLLVVATPIGWVGLLVGGVVVAGTAAAATITTNQIVKGRAGSFYDELMEWISP